MRGRAAPPHPGLYWVPPRDSTDIAVIFIIPDFPNPNIYYSFIFNPAIHYTASNPDQECPLRLRTVKNEY